MTIQKKHIPIFVGLGILLAYLGSRLVTLMYLPIFTDEAIYVRWVQIALDDPAQRFISLTDGKQPLFIWLGMIFVNYIGDPLQAVRLVSVAAGVGTATGLYFLAKELFKDQKTALTASFMYVIFPFALVCDRLALYDSLVATLAVWSLYLQVVLVRRKRLDIALIAAVVIGAGLLTKSSALFFIYLAPASLLLFDFSSKTRAKDFIKWSLLAGVMISGAMLGALILRLSPFFYIIAEKNTTFVYPISEWISHPLALVGTNLKSLVAWLVVYLTAPVLVLIVAAFFVDKNYLREKLLLMVWFVAPFGALALFGKLLFPRFVFFMTMPLLVLAAFGLVSIVGKVKATHWKLLIVILALAPMIYADFRIMTNFSRAPIPALDKSQLLDGYASGVGVEKTVAYLKEESRDQQIYVATEGTFGLMPHALQVYLSDNPNVAIKGFWPVEGDIPQEVLEAANKMPTFFVFYATCSPAGCSRDTGVAPDGWPVRQIIREQRADKTLYTLYQVLPE